jgi:hypothetical protein
VLPSLAKVRHRCVGSVARDQSDLASEWLVLTWMRTALHRPEDLSAKP